MNETKVALYVRVSTEEQATEGYSIAGQIQILRDYCNKNDFKVVKIYKDEGISGKSTERPSLQELLEDSKHNNFDMVMVWKVSRLSRKQVDFLNILDHFQKNNIKLYSYSDNIDASTPMGIAMLQMLGTFSELERNMIVENVKMGMTQRAKEGKWNGGSVLGYSSKEKKLVINENEAYIIRYIFDLYVSGKGFKSIANQLNHEGYMTKRKANFSTNSIRQIIMNPIYSGLIRFNQYEDWNVKKREGKSENIVLVKGEHQPIISNEVWEKSQVLFIQRSSKPAKTFTGNFPLTTLLRCPKCGQGMIGHKSKKGKNSNEYLRYYQCGNFHYKGSAVCKSNLLNADLVEEFVFKRLEEITSQPTVLESIVEKVNDRISKLKNPIKAKQTNIEERIFNTEKNIKKFLSIIENSDNPPDSILEKLNELDNEKKILLEQMKEIEYELGRPIIKEVSLEQIQQVLSMFSKILPNISHEKQKNLLHSIINKITVNEGNSPQKRSVKDIELYFDASPNNNYVFTYGTVHPS
ncbi:recombinase family protein [Planococcus halocryophilus]|uniref:recombinase family protein n=1 Tax=Planococcus halocryophilus TaxID=1215089 RepID=UPI001F114C7D|nr:recombinase family protein [Planococcus halocryophilus]MCH4825555.1 recombinase family protein [Planococcus halocryophilus]